MRGQYFFDWRQVASVRRAACAAVRDAPDPYWRNTPAHQALAALNHVGETLFAARHAQWPGTYSNRAAREAARTAVLARGVHEAIDLCVALGAELGMVRTDGI
jgi:hypothetical protein